MIYKYKSRLFDNMESPGTRRCPLMGKTMVQPIFHSVTVVRAYKLMAGAGVMITKMDSHPSDYGRLERFFLFATDFICQK